MTSDIARGIDVLSWTGPAAWRTRTTRCLRVDRARGARTVVGSPVPASVPAHPYTDRDRIPPVHVDNVDCATFRGIVAGFRDGSYGPRLPVRRDQMASFIARMIDTAQGARPLPAAGTSDDRFEDIDGNVHEDNIKRLYAAGIIAGRSETSYAPGQAVRRDQVASFVLRAAAYASGVDLDSVESDDQAFPDVGPDNVHFERVNGAAELGLVAGRTDGRYYPASSTERAQMASVVVRSLIHVEQGAAATSARSTANPDDTGAAAGSSGGGPLAAAAQLGVGAEEGLALLLLLLLPAAVLHGRRHRPGVVPE
jgi:hypothetical protein